MPTATDRAATTGPDQDPLWLSAAEVEERFGIPAGTIRSQASRGRLHARGLDRQGRKLYATAEVRRINAIPDPDSTAAPVHTS